MIIQPDMHLMKIEAYFPFLTHAEKRAWKSENILLEVTSVEADSGKQPSGKEAQCILHEHNNAQLSYTKKEGCSYARRKKEDNLATTKDSLGSL